MNPKKPGSRIRKPTPYDAEIKIALKEYVIYKERCLTAWDSYNRGAQAAEMEQMNKEAKQRRQMAPYIFMFLTRRPQQT